MGSDLCEREQRIIELVSIHAPTWGATGRVVYRGNNNAFQSTLPHGERRPRSFSPTARRCFNPRSRMGSDRAKIAVSWPSKCFNPRSHTGSDTHVRKAHQGKLVSIHAPTWGATNKRGSSYVVSSFQSTLPHGERHKNKAAYVNAMMFQSTLPHGERPVSHRCFLHPGGFNPRSHTGSDR